RSGGLGDRRRQGDRSRGRARRRVHRGPGPHRLRRTRGGRAGDGRARRPGGRGVRLARRRGAVAPGAARWARVTNAELKRSIARGIAWVGLASSLVALCDLVALALILNFWVSAKEFGDVSVVVTAFGALQLAAELGLPAAIVGREDPDEDRLSTIFWIGIGAGVAEYALVWLAPPPLRRAYGEPIVGWLFRVAGLVLMIRPLYTAHQALLRRSLRFQELSAVRMAANTVELITKIGSAAAGAGVWCLALGPIGRELAYAIG